MDEDIGYFDVPVDDLIVIQVGQSLENVLYIWLCASLCKTFVLA